MDDEQNHTKTDVAVSSEDVWPGVESLKKRAFLDCLVQSGGNIGKATAAIGYRRLDPYNWRRNDPAFAEQWIRAKELGVEMLEAEAIRRAYEGVEEPAGWHKGEPGMMVRKYSDTLLIFLLKGALPDKYRERVDVRGTIANLDFSRLSDEQLDRIAAGEHPLAVLTEGVRQLQSRDVADGVIQDAEVVDDDDSEDGDV